MPFTLSPLHYESPIEISTCYFKFNVSAIRVLAGERRDVSIHLRMNELEAGLARVDERTHSLKGLKRLKR
jgi:hypothetical protein